MFPSSSKNKSKASIFLTFKNNSNSIDRKITI